MSPLLGLQSAILFRILSRHGGILTALLVTALFAFNWRVVATNLCGLETPLALAMLLLIVDRLDRTPPERLGQARSAVALGLLAGAAVYARFDMLLFSGLAILYLAATSLRLGVVRAALQGGLATAALVLTLVPWFVFSMEVSGVLLPNSREAVALLMGQGGDMSSAPSALAWLLRKVFSGVHWIPDSANLLGLWPTALPSGRMSQIAALAVSVFTLWVFLSAVRRRRGMPPFVWLCLVFFLAHCTYYFLNLRLETRYVLPAFTCLIVVLGVLLGGGGRAGLPGFRPASLRFCREPCSRSPPSPASMRGASTRARREPIRFMAIFTTPRSGFGRMRPVQRSVRGTRGFFPISRGPRS